MADQHLPGDWPQAVVPVPGPTDDTTEPHSKWGRWLLVGACSIVALFGIATFVLQVTGQQDAKNRDHDNRVANCRATLRNQYVDIPTAQATRIDSRLAQIQAAGLEALASKSNRSVSDNHGAFDGKTIGQLRQLSADARRELAIAQDHADHKLDRFTQLTKLAQTDSNRFLAECKKVPT